MDDPWANAWGEPTKPVVDSHTLWPPSSLNDGRNSEADVGIPSWVTGVGVKWSEPSQDQATLWHPTPPEKEWESSPYENISFSKPSSDQFEHFSATESIETIISSSASVTASPRTHESPILAEATISHSSSHPPTPLSASVPGSPDPFGTFETALDNETNVDPWSQSLIPAANSSPKADVLAPSWDASDHDIEVKVVTKRVDEWEAAEQQKQKQDQHVPPQLLASILGEFETLSNDLWPTTSENAEQTLSTSIGHQDGVDGVEGLAIVAGRLIPQTMTLPQYIAPSKTFIAKNMVETLRLTRHVPITRISPFALYIMSKGSTAWETSVKSRPEVVKDDILPPGWRVVEKDKEEAAPAIESKKKTGSGGLLSFFGRRGAPASLETNLKRSASPVQQQNAPTTSTPSPTAVKSTRTSTDSVKSLSTLSNTSMGTLSSNSSSHTTTLPEPSIHPAINSPSRDVTETAQAPSAVSRFLTRFSRNSTPGPSPRDSLALSIDDLEFLSDIVPNATDETDEASQLKELSSLISSPPLATKLPPPLAPPPRLPQPRASLNSSAFPPGFTSTTLNIDDDTASLFSSPPDRTSLLNSSAPLSRPSSSTITPPSITGTFSLSNTVLNIAPQATGSSSPHGRPSSSYDLALPLTRTHTPAVPKRNVTAIMSTGSSSPISSTSVFALPPPPILSPPSSRQTASALEFASTSRPHSHSTAAEKQNPKSTGDHFSDFDSSPPQSTSFNTSLSSVYSDRSLISSSSSNVAGNDDFLDDFDDFVSSPLRTPSPPHPPAKLTPFDQKLSEKGTQMALPSHIKHPAPRKMSRAANHQRTMSLVESAAARPGIWPAPPSPTPHPSITNNVLSNNPTALNHLTGSITPSISSPAAFPHSISQPPGLSSINAPLVPLVPPPSLQTHTSLLPTGTLRPPPSQTTPTSGPLSAQDLSFFEGL